MKNRSFPSALFRSAVTITASLALPITALAQTTYTWDGSFDNSWVTPANWVGDVAPVANKANTYVLGAVGTGSVTPYYNGPDGGGAFWGNLVFEGSRSFNLLGTGSNRFYLNGNLTNNSANLQTISMQRSNPDERGMIVNLSAPRTFNTAGGDILITGWVDAAANSGNAINKTGNFTLTLANTVANSGASWRINVNEGTLAIASVNSFGGLPDSFSTTATATKGFTVANGAAFAVGNLVTDGEITTMLGTGNFAAGASIGFDTGLGTAAGNRAYTANIVDTAQGQLGLLKMGNNTLTLSGTNTFTGNTTIRAGELSIASTTALPGWDTAGRYSVAAQAALVVANSMTDGDVATMLATGNFATNSLIGFDTTDGNRIYSDNLTGSLGLFKAGANTLTINGSNSYTGITRISEGTLQLGSALTASGRLNMTGSSILDLNGNNATFTDTSNPGSTTSAASMITNNAAGSGTSTLRFVDGGANGTSDGAITDGATRKIAVEISNVQSYIQRLKSSDSTYSGGTVIANNAAGSRLQISSYNPTTVSETLTKSEFGTGAIIIGQSATDKASIYFDTGSANKTFYNDITFNTSTGLDANWKGVAFNVVGITLAGTQTANLVDATYETFTYPSQTASITGQITGSQGLSVGPVAYSINLTLANAAGTNDYAGDTKIGPAGIVILGANNQLPDGTGKGNVNAVGTLRLNGFNDTINGLTGTGTVHNNSASTNATLTLGGGDATASFSGTIADGAAAKLALVKTGTGTQTLTVANSYTGDTTVNAGTLEIYEPYLANASSVSLGASAVLNLNFYEPEGDITATVDTLFINGVQQPAGIYGATGSGATTVNDVNFDGIGTLTVSTGPAPTSGYAAWQAANSTAQAANLDHDNDGVSNGVEHFLGGTGNTTGFTTPLPGVTNTAGTLSVTWVRHPDFPGFPGNYGTAVIVETSATLANPWTPAVVGVGAGFVEITGNNVKYTFPAGTKNFARLKVVQAP